MSEEILTAAELPSAIEGIGGVSTVSAEEQDAIKRNTAYALPDSPVAYGMRAATVKPAFWRGIVGESNSAIAFLNRLATETNGNFEVVRAVLLTLVGLCESMNQRGDEQGKMLDEQGKTLGGRLDAEEGERKAADTALGGRLDAEKKARESLDGRVVLLEQIGDVVADERRGYMTAEQAGQLANLVAMWEEDHDTMINTVAEVLAAFENAPEGTNVASVLAELRGLISTEQKARESADTELGERISAENEARGNAEVALGELIGSEKTARESADAALGGSLDAEEVERKAADTALGGRLDAEQAARRQAEVRISHGEKRLENLEARLDPEDFVTDDTTTYQKTVPATALPYASVSKIGTAYTPENLFVTLNAITDISEKVYGDDFGSIRISHDENDPSIMYVNKTLDLCDCTITLGSIRLPTGTYTMSGALGGNDDDGYVSLRLDGVENFEDMGSGVTFDWTHGADEELTLSLKFDIRSVEYRFAEPIKIMLVAGSGRCPHIPKGTYNQYVKVTKVVSEDSSGDVIDTFDIPEDVQAMFNCDGDEVDFDARVLKSYMFTAVLPTSGWTKSTAYFSLKLKTAGFPNHNTNKAEQSTLSGGYKYEKNSSEDMTWWLVNSMSTHYLRVKDSRFATLDEFTAYLESNPLTVVYVASKQVEMDISALLPLDNLIRVGGGGTLTFVNECGMPAPSTITYQQEVSE